ncbi:MAG: hypothetical protein WCR51_10565 [Planctomycetia bacterium]
MPAGIDAAITTLENSRTQQYRTLHGEFAGYSRPAPTYLSPNYAAGDLTATFVEDFAYVLSTDEAATLRAGIKIWTEDELLNMVGGGLLKPVTDTQITIEDDNIKGQSVTIVTTAKTGVAGSGAVGSFSAPITIDLSRQLTTDERVILAAAERADVTFISGTKFTGAVTFARNATGGDTLTRASGSWADDGFAAGKYIRVEGRTSNATPDRTVWEIKSVAGNVLTLVRTNQVVPESGRTVTITPVVLDPLAANATPTFIEVAQRDDIDLTIASTGTLDVTAAAYAFVGSEADLAVRQFKAGGDATVKTGGKIEAAAGTATTTVVVSGTNLVLEASDGGIGTQALPLRLDAAATGMLTARASGTVYLTEDAGDMRVETIYSQQGDAVLVTRSGSILDGNASDLTDVKAASITLTAGGTGTVGTALDLLDIEQGPAGETLTATGTGVFVREAVGTMRINTISASAGDVILEAQGSILDADVAPETVAADVSGNSITLKSVLGGVGNAGAELEIDSSTSAAGRVKISAGLLNVYVNELDGDLRLDTIGTGATATSFVSALAGKIIDARLDPASFNITSGKVYLFASQDIGAADKPITTKIANVEGKSTTGSSFIDNTGALVVGGVTGGTKGIESGGQVRLTAHSPVEITTSITAAADILVKALENPASDGDDITVTSTGSLRSTNGKVVLHAGDDVNLAAGSAVAATTFIEIRSGYDDADTRGSTITLAGELEAKLIDVRATAYADVITVASTAAVKGTLVALGLGGKDTITNTSDSSLTTAVGGIVFLVGDDADITLDATTLVPTKVASKPGTGDDDDELVNAGGFAVLIGGAGADTLTNGAGTAIILGDEGVVELTGSVVTKVESTGTVGGGDTIKAGSGTGVIIGGRGADSIEAGDGTNTILGDEGKATFDATGALTLAESTNPSVGDVDTFTLGKGTYRVIAGAGAETIALGEGTNYVIGDAGRITVGPTETTMESIEPGTGAADTITLGAGTNAVIGGSGADTIKVLAGSTAGIGIVLGDNGSFKFDNATGRVKEITGLIGDTNGAADVVELQAGVNTVITGRGADRITAGGGTNTVLSDTGLATFAADGTLALAETTETGIGDDDTITLQSGTNVVIAGAGADKIEAGNGTNYVLGDEGTIEVFTAGPKAGTTEITSTNGSTGGADSIELGDGTNVVIGGAAGDSIEAKGGAAAKAVVLGDNGRLVLTSAGVLLSAETTDSGVGAADTISLANGTNVVIAGAAADAITAGDGTNTILGDEGKATFDATGALTLAESLNPSAGAADTFTLGKGIYRVIAGAGAETIALGEGTNYVIGDAGRITVGVTETTMESIEPGTGANDTITLGAGTNAVIGGSGADTIRVLAGGAAGVGIVLGDNGSFNFTNVTGKVKEITGLIGDTNGAADTVELQNGVNTVITGRGKDSITAGGGTNTVLSDTGRATFAADGTLALAETTESDVGDDDTISLQSGTNVVIAGAGADTISIGAGTNYVLGDEGRLEVQADGKTVVTTLNDSVGGAEKITVGTGFNVIAGGAKSDEITINGTTADAKAVVLGDDGTLTLSATGVLLSVSNKDGVHASGAADTITLTAGTNAVIGGAGGDTITATTGQNTILGDDGKAEFFDSGVNLGRVKSIESMNSGLGGKDQITLEDGTNTVIAGADDDTISIGAGTNYVLGDEGRLEVQADGKTVVTTLNDSVGGAEKITVGTGFNVIAGGAKSDEITINGTTADAKAVVLGDDGTLTLSATGVLLSVSNKDGVHASGAADTITLTAGTNAVIGGAGGDTITATTGQNTILGDDGKAEFFDSGVNLGRVKSIESMNSGLGGKDQITLEDGTNTVIAGADEDSVSIGAGTAVVLGDEGKLVVNTDGTGAVTGRTIETLNDTVGGKDTITATGASSVIMGGVGGDSITGIEPTSGSAPVFIVLGDAGRAEWDAASHLRMITTQSPGTGGADTVKTVSAADIVFGGDAGDDIDTGAGADIVLGDHGRAEFDAAGRRVLIEVIDTTSGGADMIKTGTGADIVIGGSDGDTIDAGADDNIVVGDQGRLSYDATGILATVTSIDFDAGGVDDITTGTDNDLVIGGTAGDVINAGNGANVVAGDHAAVTFTNGALSGVTSIATSVGGDDTITTGVDNDIVIGGFGKETLTSTGGSDLFIGDSGRVELAANGQVTLAASLDDGVGDVDTITTAGGSDVIIGGTAGDTIQAGDGTNLVIGDGGQVTWTATKAPRPSPDRQIFWAPTAVLAEAKTATNAGGGADNITTGKDADIVLAGDAGDTVNAGDGRNVVVGDNGKVTFHASPAGQIATVATTDPDKGGNDTLTTGKDDDLVIGGVGADTINAGAGDNIVLGDNGRATIAADGTINVVEATDPTLGGIDMILSEGGNDLVIGGTGADTIDTGGGNDLVFGDFGRIDGAIALRDLPLNTSTPAFTFTSIFTQNAHLGGADFIKAGDGHDIVIGGQGADRILGEAGDDDIIGGHNVSGGDDAGDVIDAGAGRDVIAGDNARIDREPRQTGTRWRALAGSRLIEADGNGAVTHVPQADPSAAPQRDVTLFDHAESTPAGKWGADNIAGGADDDMIFGQLGNDAIQGDGAVLDAVGNIIRDLRGVRTAPLSVDDEAGPGRDGDDYIEGNGGDDVILGNLGQDDIIGGSSDLFGLTTAAQRPDGGDVIYGGSGTRVGRNDLGDLSPSGHARDADVILGDNGRIFRVVGLNGVATGGYLQFTYDTYGGMKIVPRTIQYLGYAFGQASSTAFNDEIHGEAGDDVIHGMSGNDVLFGDGQDDDLIGGQGHDRMFGGVGEDGMLGDDGRIFTSRNGLTEPIHGVLVAATQGATQLQGTVIGTVTNLAGRLKKSVDLASFYTGGHDVMYGGLGDDFLHGGAGDDAISGAEAQAAWYVTNALSGSVLGYDPVARKFARYDATDALRKIPDFILNFDAATGGTKIEDGIDNLFGNEGNDWIVGGTGRDRMFGGAGDDLLNADDNLDTAGGLNNRPDDPLLADADWAFGGIGFDVLIGNTGADRLIDWSKRFNTYVLPFTYSTASPTNDAPTVIRTPTAPIVNLLVRLAESGGYDADINPRENALRGELGLVTVDGDLAIWRANIQESRDRDPPPRNVTARVDTLGAWEKPPAIVIDATVRSVSETGASQTVNVSLATAPMGTVVLAVASANPAEVAVHRTTLTFTPLNWSVPQVVVVSGVDDFVADGATTTLVTIAVDAGQSDIFYTSAPARVVSVVNADNEPSVPTITGPAATTGVARPLITWTAIPGASGYEVRLLNASTKQVVSAMSATATTSFMPASGLGIGRYEVAVRAVMPSGLKHAWSPVTTFRIDMPVEVVPPPATFTTRRPTVGWTALAGAVRYDVEIVNARGTVVARATGVTGTSWTPRSNLVAGIGYRFWVRGVDASGLAAQWGLSSGFGIR